MKKIKLNNLKNKFIIVDDNDYLKLNGVIWTWSKTNNSACRRIGQFGNSRMILMHREIMGVDGKSGKIEVDHINHNRLEIERKI